MSRWWAGVAGWGGNACPEVVTQGTSYDPPVGMSSDGTLLYTITGSELKVRDFPALTLNDTVDLNPSMDAIGAGGGGSIRAGTINDSGNLYALGFFTSSTHLQIMQCELDGSSPTLLWTSAVAAGSNPVIGWHPAGPGSVFVLYEDVTGSRLVKVDIGTGAETTLNTFGDSYFRGETGFQQYEDGLVFFVGISDIPSTGTIWVYDISVDAFDSLTAADSFGGMGTNVDGYTYWTEDIGAFGGDEETHAFEVSAGPTITEVTPGCAAPWSIDGFLSLVNYWFATPDRSQTYVGDGTTTWQFPP